MPTYQNFGFARYEDGLLTISLAPPTAIGGQNLRFQVLKRFGDSSGLILKSIASGVAASGFASGISIISSGNGVLRVQIRSADTSGLDYGVYGWQLERTDSGSRQVISTGWFHLGPATGTV